MPEPSQFRHYQIVQDAEGHNVELVRSAEQVAVLAFDQERLEFVACHVLLHALKSKANFEDLCGKLRQNGHPLLARLVEYGEDDENPFYITSNVDGETLRGYLNRQNELPLWLATIITVRALDAALALMERGDLMPEQPMDGLRLVQTTASDVTVVVSDYRLVESASSSRSKTRLVKGNLERQIKFLRTFLTEIASGPTAAESNVSPGDFSDLLAGVLIACGPGMTAPVQELRDALRQQVPEHLAAEIPTTQKPRALIAPLLASYQDVARALVNQVRIQSQRLDMANPYSMRGTLTRTGRQVMVEQIPPTRLSGGKVMDCNKQVARLSKKRDSAALLPIAHIGEGEQLSCLAEEVVEGISLAELMHVRGQLDVPEVYLVLAGLDAAVAQVEKAALPIKKLRMEDIYLLTGMGRDDSRVNRLLATKLNEWPSFTLMLRSHPTLSSMAGRGIDPGILLPALLPGSRVPAWTGGWVAAVGCFIMGLYGRDGTARLDTANSGREREAIERMLLDELVKAREAVHSTRQDFLARFARVIHHYDVVQPTPLTQAQQPVAAQPAPVILPKAPQPAAAQPPPLRTLGAGPLHMPEPPPVALTAGGAALLEPVEEEHTIGFAELLFSGGAAEGSASSPAVKTLDAPFTLTGARGGTWGKGASDDLDTGRVGDWELNQDVDTSPFWLKALVFLSGSMVLGAMLAMLSGQALWQKKRPSSAPKPVPAAVSPAAPNRAASVPGTPPPPLPAQLQ